MHAGYPVPTKVDRKGHQSPGTEVTGNCEQSNMGARNQTEVFWKGNKELLTAALTLQPHILEV